MQLFFFNRLFSLTLITTFYVFNSFSLEAIDLREAGLYDSLSYRLHSNAQNHIFGYTSKGASLQLKDGSMWEVTPHKREMIMQWRKSENIFIKPYYTRLLSFQFVSYNYVLYNEQRNEVAEVKLSKPSMPMDGGAFVITGVEPFQQIVQLNDGTCWRVNASERDFNKWEVGHRLFVGVNNNWRTENYPYILINMDVNRVPLKDAGYFPAIFYSN